MFTPAIRAIDYPSSAPQGEMPYLVARNPFQNEKPTRARVRRRKPVKRDELQIGLALPVVKSAKRSECSSPTRTRVRSALRTGLDADWEDAATITGEMAREILLFQRSVVMDAMMQEKRIHQVFVV